MIARNYHYLVTICKYDICLTMRMNSDQEERAGKLVVGTSAWVAPALPGALCAALGYFYILNLE